MRGDRLEQLTVDLVDCPHCGSPAGKRCTTPARMGPRGNRYRHWLMGPSHMQRRDARRLLVSVAQAAVAANMKNMGDKWHGTVVDGKRIAAGDDSRDRLASRNVFKKADAFFDAIDRGEDVLDDHVDVTDIRKRAQALRPPEHEIEAW